MVDAVDTNEVISRFYFNKKDFRADNTVRHHAFMPPPKHGRMSVFRINGLDDQEVWEFGRLYVVPERGLIVGRGDLDASKVYDFGLTINPTELPHPRHANIEGWELNTEKDRLKALKLAAAARSKKI